MSMTEDEYHYDKWMSDLYAEHSAQALQEFTAERLHSYYLSHPDVAEAPIRSLQEARALLLNHATASLVFAMVAIEVGVKIALLKPIVSGLVHDASAATLITDLVISHGGDKYRDLLFHILLTIGGVNLKAFRRFNSEQLLWEEIKCVQKERNAIIHQAVQATFKQAERAISVGSAVLEQLFPEVVRKLGLHLHDGVRICSSWECEYRLIVNQID